MASEDARIEAVAEAIFEADDNTPHHRTISCRRCYRLARAAIAAYEESGQEEARGDFIGDDLSGEAQVEAAAKWIYERVAVKERGSPGRWDSWPAMREGWRIEARGLLSALAANQSQPEPNGEGPESGLPSVNQVVVDREDLRMLLQFAENPALVKEKIKGPLPDRLWAALNEGGQG